MKKSLSKSNKSTFFFLNKRLIRHYALIKTWKAGLVLKGEDVKMILQSNFDISSSFVHIDKKNEVFLKGVKMKKAMQNLSSNSTTNYKLLLHKKEILHLKIKKQQGPFTIIPTKIFLENYKLKLEIALAKYLKKYSKKQKLIEKDLERKKNRDLSSEKF